MNTQPLRAMSLATLVCAVAAALTLAACDRGGDKATVGERVDGAIAEAQQSTAETGEAIQANAADATITTKINVALAADDTLSASRIDVDTTNGRVKLTGTAPNAAARDRATTLAAAVEGVLEVNNQLAIAGS